jgi:RNA polymerase sigma factor (sigma-70 family)
MTRMQATTAAKPAERWPQSALLAELKPVVVRTVRLIVGAGSAVAEDAAQEALIELAQAFGTLRDPAAGPAFAARIAARVALRVARRERRLAVLGMRSSRVIESVAADELPDLLELKQAFDRLPPRQRATAVLRLYVGLSEQETARALRCSAGTVKRQLHDARRALAQGITELNL